MFKILLKKIFKKLLILFFSIFYEEKYLEVGLRFAINCFIYQKILGFNRKIPWPVSPFCFISNPNNIEFDPGDLNNFQMWGCYFQNFAGKIKIGSGTFIGPNVGLITANHDYNYNLRGHNKPQDIIIGRNCWIGMNSVILPGVILGDNTVVAAGSVVGKNRKFSMGNVIIGGNPAQILWKIERNKGIDCADRT